MNNATDYNETSTFSNLINALSHITILIRPIDRCFANEMQQNTMLQIFYVVMRSLSVDLMGNTGISYLQRQWAKPSVLGSSTSS